MSWPRTLWDEIASYDGDPLAQAQLVDAVAVFPSTQIRPSMSVYAPCCGRKTSADAVWDVRAVPGTEVKAGGSGSPTDHDWLCGDACVGRLIRDRGNSWTKSELSEKCGADAATVRHLKAKEAVAAVRRQAVQDYRQAKRDGAREREAKQALRIDPVAEYERAIKALEP